MVNSQLSLIYANTIVSHLLKIFPRGSELTLRQCVHFKSTEVSYKQETSLKKLSKINSLFSLYQENLKRCKLNPFTSLRSGLSGQGYIRKSANLAVGGGKSAGERETERDRQTDRQYDSCRANPRHD